MNSNNTARKSVRRAALAAGLAAVVALPLALTSSAQASPGATAFRTVSGKPSDSVTRIADFYGAYMDAQSDPDHGGKLVDALRKYYVSASCLKEIKAWETKNHADGVLQAQNVPVKWTVTDNGTADYTEAAVTLTWGDRTTTKLIVDMSRSHKIIHIGTKGIEGK
ncbi:hypothetical protein [Streptomyces sp. NPDC005485]|uniref:hypothetical protein n=1 Tax=Streptomyces sp. NPDC005485 TaxID=3155591 RepID=UPI0033A83A0A